MQIEIAIAIIALVLIIFCQAIVRYIETKRMHDINEALVNKLMAMTSEEKFATYVNGTTVLRQPKVEDNASALPDLLETDGYSEGGIPIR